MSRFGGKVALITGASSGIGEAIAVAFAKEGAKLAITGRNKERLSNVARECEGYEGCEVLELIADVTDFDALKSLVDQTAERFGGLDILVNNAGVALFGLVVEKYDAKTYNNVFNANVRAPVFLSQYALPYLRKSKGCIVNISSVMSQKSVPGGVAYCMSKCALDNFTQGMAAECSADGVRVNSISPGLVATRIFSSLGFAKEQVDGFIKEKEDDQPFGILQSHELAESVLFVCSTPRMTGTNLVLDGGYHLDK